MPPLAREPTVLDPPFPRPPPSTETSPAPTLWPQNSRHLCHNYCPVNGDDVQAEINASASQVFVEDDDIDIAVYELRDGESSFTSEIRTLDDIQNFANQPRQAGTTIISIGQATSWSELDISKRACQILFGALAICPSFWQTLKHFRAVTNPDGQTASNFYHDCSDDDNDGSFETSFIVKHVQLHGRQQYNPWSTKQTGFLQKFDAGSGTNVIILLNPFKSLVDCLKATPAKMNVLATVGQTMYCSTEQWDSYLTYLESKCRELSKKAMLSNTTTQSVVIPGQQGLELHLTDVQELEKVQNTLHLTVHMLNINEAILAHFLTIPISVNSEASTQSNISLVKRPLASLRNVQIRNSLHKQRGQNMLGRLDGTSVLSRSILEGRTLDQLRLSSTVTADLAQLARDDSIKATKRAQTLNTITVLGFVYLPASFVATLLGTQYFKLPKDKARNRYSLEVAPEMWIWLILTLILFAFTAIIWLLWRLRVHHL